VAKSRLIKANGEQQGFALQAAAMATVFSTRGTSIAVGGTIPTAWAMAREAAKKLPEIDEPSDRIKLVQKFLASEISPEFELIGMLARGVAVHHAALSDEVRTLVEWLAEEGDLRVLVPRRQLRRASTSRYPRCFLATNVYPYGIEMHPREFWNLAGRAGRMNQDSVGVVGIAEANRPAMTLLNMSKEQLES
jgi:hypothetical protein